MRRNLAEGHGTPVPPGTEAATAVLVRQRLAEDPGRPVVVADDGTVLTRRDLHDRALRLGSALVRRGLRPGAVVGFQLPNWPEACVVDLACALYGFVLCPLLTVYRERELGLILADTDCAALFIPGTFRDVAFAPLVGRALAEHRPGGAATRPAVFGVRTGGGADTLEALLDEPGPVLPPGPVGGGTVRTVIYTSGSTGRPKGVLHSHDTIAAFVRRAAGFWGMGATDRLLVPSPVGHIGGSMYAFDLPWLTGGAAFLMEAWNPAEAVRRIDAEALTFCAGATPFLSGLLNAAVAAGTPLPSLRRFICGGASVPPALVEAATAQFPNAVVSRAYGSTEVPLVCAGIRSRADAERGAHTDGEIGVEVRIVDEHGAAVPAGTEGDIAVRSDGAMLGYLDTADEAGQWTPDGFFRMGDLGRMVDSRFVVVTGRRKELIIRMGENISPLEVETVLLTSDALERVAVVGIPHPRTGERAVAFVTVRPGRSFTFADMTGVLTRAGLARPKFPEALHVVDAIPVNAVGKVVKAELKRMAMAQAGT